MDQNSRIEIDIIESQLRENYGKIVYSHKTQEKCADILAKQNKLIKNSQIILSALITTGLLVRIFKGNECALIFSTILSAIQFGLTSFLKEYNLGETIQKHSAAALELLEIREKYLSLITDVKANIISIQEVVTKRDELLDELSKLTKVLLVHLVKHTEKPKSLFKLMKNSHFRMKKLTNSYREIYEKNKHYT